MQSVRFAQYVWYLQPVWACTAPVVCAVHMVCLAKPPQGALVTLSGLSEQSKVEFSTLLAQFRLAVAALQSAFTSLHRWYADCATVALGYSVWQPRLDP